jgi:hypothetical protein
MYPRKFRSSKTVEESSEEVSKSVYSENDWEDMVADDTLDHEQAGFMQGYVKGLPEEDEDPLKFAESTDEFIY